MIQYFRKLYENKPLHFILGVGLLLRLLAALFSKGYGMTDDHYKIITEAQNLMIGNPSDYWNPAEAGIEGKRSIFYPYLHYLLFSFLEAINIFDPQIKMYVVRIIHALYSLFTIYFSYKITLAISNKEIAKKVGLLAAMLWFLPMLSVRNLIEVVCIPLLMGGTYYAILGFQEKRAKTVFLLAGILLGYAFSVRYQTLAFTAGLGLFLLGNKKYNGLFLLSSGVLIAMIMNHYVLESLVFGFPPFIKIINYINFNLTNASNYITGPWYNFILLFLGIFIPPLSIIFSIGIAKVWKKQLILFLPFMLFFLFHSVFPGKQERFILPVLMFFPMLGLIGYEELQKGNRWFQQRPRFFKASWKAFWIVNLILLLPITLTYSKKSKVEAMYYLAEKADEEKDVMLFCSGNRRDIITMPAFYSKMKKYPHAYRISNHDQLKAFEIETQKITEDKLPDYLFLFEHEDQERKLETFKAIFPKLEFIKTVDASLIDQLMHRLNPKNRNHNIHIYKCR